MKYKLIKEYPGSPKLQYITTNDGCYFMTECKNYPEFWEPVVEKDYEILSLIFNKYGNLIKKDTILTKNNDNFENLLEHGCWNIHSVKRLSDGEIFTIGDLVGTPGSVYPLKEFKIIDSENTVAAHYYKDKIGGSGHYNHRLKNLKKAKQPLFTTEDDVDIFEGDEFYSTRKDCSDSILKYNGNCLEIASTKCEEFVDFSTKEKAEEYVLMNKPCLSLKEVLEIVPFLDRSGKKLKELVQQKLNK